MLKLGPTGFTRYGLQSLVGQHAHVEPVGKGTLDPATRSGIAAMGVVDAGEWLEVAGAGERRAPGQPPETRWRPPAAMHRHSTRGRACPCHRRTPIVTKTEMACRAQ